MTKIYLLLLFCVHYLIAAPQFQFKGNEIFSDDELIFQSGIPDEFVKIPESRKDFILGEAAANLQDLYFSRGFFNARVWANREKTDSEEILIFNINEQGVFYFGDINIDQPTWTSFNFPIENLSIDRKDIFSSERLQNNQESIRKSYQDQGYLHVQVSQDINIDTLRNLVHITYKVNPQRRVYLDRVIVKAQKGKSYLGPSGSEGLSDSASIAALWPTEKGQFIKSSDISTMRSKLLSTGAFSRVTIRDSLADESSIQSLLIIDISERVPGKWGGSAFYEELIGFGALANFKYLNLGGQFHQMNAEALAAQRRQRLSLGYAHPILFGTKIRFEDRVIINQESLPLPENPDSLEKRIELINRGKISYPLNSNIRISALTDLRYVDVNASEVRFKWEPSISLNYTNDKIEPTKGFKSTFSFGQGGPFNIEDRHWYLEFINRFYIPLSYSSTWAFAVDYGKTFQQANLDDARLFYQGGFRSVRGYAARSIFPSQGEGDSLLTGTAPEYWRVSNEFRFNLPKRWLGNLQLVQFTDWALISDLNSDFKSSNKKALGFGLRYNLSLLTIRLDYTLKKDLENPFRLEPFSFGRFSFDLSQAI